MKALETSSVSHHIYFLILQALMMNASLECQPTTEKSDVATAGTSVEGPWKFVTGASWGSKTKL